MTSHEKSWLKIMEVKMSKTPKVLLAFRDDMRENLQEIWSKAINDNLGGKIIFNKAYLQNIFRNKNLDYELLCDALKCFEEIESVKFDGTNMLVKTDSNFAKYPDTFINEGCYSDVEIICARHTLWIYDDPDGEQADFTGYIVHNIDFTVKNLCGAIFKDAVFKNCTFDDATLCNCDFTNSVFENCNFDKAILEESNFKSAYFEECSFVHASMLHSKFESTAFSDCNMDEADAYQSYVENLSVVGCSNSEECFEGCVDDYAEHNSEISMS